MLEANAKQAAYEAYAATSRAAAEAWNAESCAAIRQYDEEMKRARATLSGPALTKAMIRADHHHDTIIHRANKVLAEIHRAAYEELLKAIKEANS